MLLVYFNALLGQKDVGVGKEGENSKKLNNKRDIVELVKICISFLNMQPHMKPQTQRQ